MAEIIPAAAGDVAAVAQLYDVVNDYFAAHGNACYPNWQKGKYPVLADAQRALAAQTLYILLADGTIAGSVIIDHTQHPEYRKMPWTLQVPEEDVMVLHTLVVHPQYRGRGLGERLVRFGLRLCRDAGAKALRLDTHYQNLPARRLYEKCGFHSLGCQKAFVDGITQEFDVFEYYFPFRENSAAGISQETADRPGAGPA